MGVLFPARPAPSRDSDFNFDVGFYFRLSSRLSLGVLFPAWPAPSRDSDFDFNFNFRLSSIECRFIGQLDYWRWRACHFFQPAAFKKSLILPVPRYIRLYAQNNQKNNISIGYRYIGVNTSASASTLALVR